MRVPFKAKGIAAAFAENFECFGARVVSPCRLLEFVAFGMLRRGGAALAAAVEPAVGVPKSDD